MDGSKKGVYRILSGRSGGGGRANKDPLRYFDLVFFLDAFHAVQHRDLGFNQIIYNVSYTSKIFFLDYSKKSISVF